MTYQDLKHSDPFNHRVLLRWGVNFVGFSENPVGRVLAIVDPIKYGRKCVLFMMETPERKFISRESAYRTIERKSFTSVVDPSSMIHPWLGKMNGIDLKNKISLWGKLRWIEPSRIQLMLDEREPDPEYADKMTGHPNGDHSIAIKNDTDSKGEPLRSVADIYEDGLLVKRGFEPEIHEIEGHKVVKFIRTDN